MENTPKCLLQIFSRAEKTSEVGTLFLSVERNSFFLLAVLLASFLSTRKGEGDITDGEDVEAEMDGDGWNGCTPLLNI